MTLTVAGAAMFTLAACHGFDYGRYKGEAASSNAYNAALQKGYLDLSKNEFAEGDYRDSDRFASRAHASAQNQPPKPEDIGARNLPKDKVSEMTDARNRLVAAQNANATTKMPAEAAKAQVMFDCWMQEQEENFQTNDIKGCKDGFFAALAAIEAKPAAAAPAPTVMTTPDRFLAFFDFDKYNLTADAKKVVSQAAETAKKTNAKVTVVGHTDRAGSDDYNMRLSQRRADTVKAEMVRLGIPAASITTVAKGETQNLVPTKDGVREPQNRRTEIMLQKAGA
jgi:OOP family OmpA-OmpF porin